MSPSATCAGGGLLAMLAAASFAELQPSAIAVSGTSSAQNQRLLVGWNDPATGAGDVQSFDSPAATHPRWSAAAQLRSLQQAPEAGQRTLRSAGLGQGSMQWTAFAKQYGAAPMGAVRNANLWFVAAKAGDAAGRAMVYTGTTGGILHGFTAEDGHEALAYVPRHRQGAPQPDKAVDGPIFGGQAPVGPRGELVDLLVAGLGAGGRGFIVLDVSAPDRFASMRVEDLALVDTTADADPDIGQLHAPAVVDDVNPNRARHVVQLANGRWAVVFGNGYFSRAGQPVLLVQYLDQSRELLRLSPCMAGAPCAHAGGNGLAMPRLLDSDGDGRVDLAYAGDLQGHLWRFDLRGADSDWHTSHFFTACDADGRRQPITTAPYAQAHPMGGWMLVVGTGHYLQQSDSAVSHTQSLYGLHDRGAADPLQAEESACRRPDTLRALGYSAVAAEQGVSYHAIQTVSTPDAARQVRGWWVDFPYAGQRVLHNPQLFEGSKLTVRSVVPSGDPQQPRTAGQAWLSVVNLGTGSAAAQPPFAVNDPLLQAQPLAMASAPAGPALLFRRPGEAWLRFADGRHMPLLTGLTVGARAGWRERP